MFRDFIPGLGQKTARQRLKEVDRKVLTIFGLLTVGFYKVAEHIVGLFARNFPIVVFGLHVSHLVFWTLYVLVLLVPFVLFGRKLTLME